MMIAFNKDWKKATIKKIVKENCYCRFGDHEDLKGLCICPFDDEDYKADYQEMTYIVPSKWLKNIAKEEFEVEDLDLWLQTEYTSDESEVIFERALNERQIVMIDFN